MTSPSPALHTDAQNKIYFDRWRDQLVSAAHDRNATMLAEMLSALPSARPYSDGAAYATRAYSKQIAIGLAHALSMCPLIDIEDNACAKMLIAAGAPRRSVGSCEAARLTRLWRDDALPSDATNAHQFQNFIRVAGLSNPSECVVAGKRFLIEDRATLLSAFLNECYSVEASLCAAEYLLDAGVSVNENGGKAMLGLLENTTVDRPTLIWELLFSRGADLHLCRDEMPNRLWRAPESVFNRLCEAGLDPTHGDSLALVHAARQSISAAPITYMIHAGCDANAHGGAPLFNATYAYLTGPTRGIADNVRELLRLGARHDVTLSAEVVDLDPAFWTKGITGMPPEGMTPEGMSARYGNYAITAMLAAARVSAQLQVAPGLYAGTALGAAVRGRL